MRASVDNGPDVRQQDLREPLTFFKESRLAAVFCHHAIEHLDDKAQEAVMGEAFRLVAPGGQLRVNSPCRYFEPARFDRHHMNLPTPSELRQKVEAASVINCKPGYNGPQEVPEMPREELTGIWKACQPDLLSQTVYVAAFKPCA